MIFFFLCHGGGEVIPSFFLVLLNLHAHLWRRFPPSLILVAAAVAAPRCCAGRRGERRVGRRTASGESTNRCRRRGRRRCRRRCRRRRRRRRRCQEERGARSSRPAPSSSRSEGSGGSSLSSRAEGQAAQHRRRGERKRELEKRVCQERIEKKCSNVSSEIEAKEAADERGLLNQFVGLTLSLSSVSFFRFSLAL